MPAIPVIAPDVVERIIAVEDSSTMLLRRIIDAEQSIPVQPLSSSRAAARSLRSRAEAIRHEAITHHRVGSLDPDLVEDMSSRVVAAVLAPMLAALEGARGSHREAEIANAVFDLFDLDGQCDMTATECLEQMEER